MECHRSTHLKVATPRLPSTRRSEFWYLNKTTRFFGLLPGVTSANSRWQRAEHQRGSGDSHRARAAPPAAHSLPDRGSQRLPRGEGGRERGTRLSPGSGGGLAGHGAPIHPSIHPPQPRSAQPGESCRARRGWAAVPAAGPSRGESGAGQRLHGDSLLPPLAWPSRSFPKLHCEQEIHPAEDPTPHRRMVTVAIPPLISREGRRVRVFCFVLGLRSFFVGQGGLFPYLLHHIDD